MMSSSQQGSYTTPRATACNTRATHLALTSRATSSVTSTRRKCTQCALRFFSTFHQLPVRAIMKNSDRTCVDLAQKPLASLRTLTSAPRNLKTKTGHCCTSSWLLCQRLSQRFSSCSSAVSFCGSAANRKRLPTANTCSQATATSWKQQ